MPIARLLVVPLLLLAAMAAMTAEAAAPEPIGEGADAVYVLRPSGPICSVVLFGHGWTDYTPANYMSWFDHLRARGSAIVFPQYQTTGSDPIVAVTAAWKRGARAGFEELGLPPTVPVVVAGYSAGAPLAFQSAIWTKEIGIPVPYAVHAVYPLGGTLTFDRSLRFPRKTKVLIQVGALDDVVGRRGGDDLWRVLHRHPRLRKRFQVVRARSGVAQHLAPLGNTEAVHRTFWAPLDRFVGDAQRASGRC